MAPRTGKQTDLGQVDGGAQAMSVLGVEQVLLLKAV